jgi:hypothetical protein
MHGWYPDPDGRQRWYWNGQRTDIIRRTWAVTA